MKPKVSKYILIRNKYALVRDFINYRWIYLFVFRISIYTFCAIFDVESFVFEQYVPADYWVGFKLPAAHRIEPHDG